MIIFILICLFYKSNREKNQQEQQNKQDKKDQKIQIKEEYKQNDLIGKTGIESLFEKYLKGKKGTKQIDMAVDGTTTAEVVEDEAVAGSNVILTIDSKLQKIAEEALKDRKNKKWWIW